MLLPIWAVACIPMTASRRSPERTFIVMLVSLFQKWTLYWATRVVTSIPSICDIRVWLSPVAERLSMNHPQIDNIHHLDLFTGCREQERAQDSPQPIGKPQWFPTILACREANVQVHSGRPAAPPSPSCRDHRPTLTWTSPHSRCRGRSRSE